MRAAQKIVGQSYHNAKDHKDKGLSIKRARTILENLNLNASFKDKVALITMVSPHTYERQVRDAQGRLTIHALNGRSGYAITPRKSVNPTLYAQSMRLAALLLFNVARKYPSTLDTLR